MNFYVRRIAFYIVTLWAAISLNFLLPRLLPGDPAAIMLGKLRRANGGRPLSEETIQTITSILGAEKGMSLWDQYLAYWGRLLHGDLGVSVHAVSGTRERPHRARHCRGRSSWSAPRRSSRSCSESASARGWAGSAAPRSTTSCRCTTFLQSIPYFWLALVLVAVFSVQLGLLPDRRRLRRVRVPRGAGVELGVLRERGAARASFPRRRSSSRRSAAGCSGCAT